MEPVTGEQGNSSHVEQGSSEDVIKLENAMTIRAGNDISIVCDSKVKVEHLIRQGPQGCPGYEVWILPSYDDSHVPPSRLVDATTPIKLIAGSWTLMRISATKPLDSGFADGWRKLPDELKIAILKMNLTFNRKICYSCNALTDLYHHLALGPEISSLALQVFYGFNNIQVWDDVKSIPPRSARPHIRSLLVQACVPSGNQWLRLRKFADANSGFSGLRNVEISVDFPNFDRRDFPVSLRDLEISRPPVHFSCNGKIEFLDSLSTEKYRDIERKLERKVRELITFVE